MAHIARRTIIAYLACLSLSMLVATCPAAPLLVELQSTKGLPAGKVADGTVIAHGTLTHNGDHLGFQLWPDPENGGGNGNIYRFRGINSRYPLRVTVRTVGWHAGDQVGKLINLTSQASIGYDIVTAGDQVLPSDIWPIHLQAGVIQP